MASQGVNNLQRWCKQNTLEYSGVNVRNMTSSWRNGLAFCALIHHFRPDLIDFESLEKDDVFHNNKLAFEVAEKELGIVAFLDPRDMVAMKTPDRLSVITYVQQYYHHFSKMACPEEKLQVDAHSDKKSVSSESEETDKENHGLFEELSSKCHICRNKVHLVERIIEDGNVYHRHCHRKCSLRRLYGAPNQSFSVLQHKSQTTTTTQKTQPLNGMSEDSKSVQENIKKGHSLASTIDFLSTSSETEDDEDGMTSEDALDSKASAADEGLAAAEQAESPSEKPGQSQPDKIVESPSEKPGQSQPDNIVESPSEKPGQSQPDKIVESPSEKPGQSQPDKVVELNPFLDDTDGVDDDDIIKQKDEKKQASCEDSNLFSDMKPVDRSKNQKPSPKDQPSTVSLLQVLPSAKARSVRPKPQPSSSNTPTNPFGEEATFNSNPFEVEEEEEASNNNPFGDDEEEDVVLASNNASAISLNPFGDVEEQVENSHSKLSQSSTFNPFLEEGEAEEASKPPAPTTRRKARAPPPPPPPPSATVRKQVVTDSNKGSDGGSTTIRSKPPPVPAPRKKVKAPSWKDEVAKKMEEANQQNLQNEKFVSVQPPPTPVAAEKKKSSTSGTRRKAAVKPGRVAPGFGFPLVKREIKASEEEKITENDLLDELEAIDGKLKELEHRGIQLENILRNAMSPGSEWKADSDQLLKEWFEVVQEKNRLVRSETLLMYQMQEQKLEEEHAEIEFRIRKLMNKPEKDRTAEEKEEEQKLLDNLVKVVERRNKIILSIEDQRVREEEEEEAYSVIKEVKRQSLNNSVDTSASKEHKKKKKKLKVKKMFKKSKKNKESNAAPEEKREEKVKEKSSLRLSIRKKN